MAPSFAAISLSVTLLLIACTKGGGETESSLNYWKRNLPTLALPPSLRDLVSPLQLSASSQYKLALISRGSLGNICKAGNLYCSAADFEVFRQKITACVIQANFHRHPGRTKNSKMHGQFFKEKALVKGAVFKLDEQASVVPIRAFLPRVVSTQFPLSTTSFLELQRLFNIPPKSLLAKEIKETVDLCSIKQENLLTGEDAVCVSSMEDLVDLIKAKLFKSPSLASVEMLQISGGEKARATATVKELQLRSSEEDGSSIYLSCHNVMYPSSAFYCHHVANTRVYSAKLQIEDGTLVDAVAVCHMDTSEWTPLHVAFFDLNATPGHTEACHWFHEGSLVFVRSSAV